MSDARNLTHPANALDTKSGAVPSQTGPMALPDALVLPLQAVDQRRRRLRLVQSLAEATVVFTGLSIVSIAVDQVATPGTTFRWMGALTIWSATAAVVLWRGLLPGLLRPPLVDIARRIERQLPACEEHVSSAIELAARSDPRISAWMVARTIAMASGIAADIDPRQVVSSRSCRRVVTAALIISMGLGVAVVNPSTRGWLIRALAPGVGQVRPSRFSISVQPGEGRIARGSPLIINAQISPTPENVRCLIEWDDGLQEQLPMEGRGDVFHLDLAAVTRSFHYRIDADDGESSWYAVTAVEPPVLAGISATVTPPTYTGLPSRMHAGGDVEVVAGSRIALMVEFADAPVRGAVLIRNGHEDVPFTSIDAEHAMVQFLPESTQVYGIRLTAEGGITVEPTTRWQVMVRPDAAPSVALACVDVGSGLVGPEDQLVLSVHAVDDHGLRDLTLVVTDDRGGIERRALLQERGGAPRSVDRFEGLDLADLAIDIGDQLKLHVEAVDQGGLRSQSESIVLTIIGESGAQSAALAERLRLSLIVVDRVLGDLRSSERSWASLLRTFRGEDPAAQRGELLLLGSRMDELCTRIGATAETLRKEGLGSGIASGRALVGIADDCSAWSIGHRRVLAQAARAATGIGASTEDVQRGRDLSDSAHRALEPIRSTLALAIARLDAEALAGSTSAALQRSRRLLPILRGVALWQSSAWEPGLRLEVFAGPELEGTAIYAAQGTPSLEAVTASGRLEQVSARWTGELRARETGAYQMAVVVDDGARVFIDGRSLLPAEAWGFQAPTLYAGNIDLEAGWHSLTIEYRQGQSGARCDVTWGLVNGALAPIAMEDVRSRSAQVNEDELVRSMIASSPAAVNRANEAFRRALAVTGHVADGLAGLAGETGRERLQHLARQAVDDARVVLELSTMDTITNDPQQAVERMARLDALARSARDHLVDVVDSPVRDGYGLAIERAMVEDIRSRADAMRRIKSTLPAADRGSAMRREVTAATSATGALDDRLTSTRKLILERVRRTTATRNERSRSFQAWDSLDSKVADVFADLEETILNLPEAAPEAAQLLDKAARKLDAALKNVEEDLVRADAERQSALANAVLSAFAHHVLAEPGPYGQQRLDLAVDRLTQQLRTDGRPDLAVQVQNSVDLGMRLRDRSVVESVLGPMSRQVRGDINDGKVAQAAITRAANRLSVIGFDAHDHLDRVREELHAAGAGLRLQSLDRQVRSRRLIELAEESDTLAAMMVPDVMAVVDLGERVAAALTNTQPETEPSEDDLRGLLDSAVEDARQRKKVLDLLARQGDRPIPDLLGKGAIQREMIADRLEALRSRERKLVVEEQAARDEFSQAEQQVADAYERMADQFLVDRSLGLRGLVPVLQEAVGSARRRAELAHASGALPGAEGAQLAANARRNARRVADGAVTPVAQRVMTSDARDRAIMAEVGAGLTEAMHQEEDAARGLERSLARRAANRAALMRVHAQAAMVLGDGVEDLASLQAEAGTVPAQLHAQQTVAAAIDGKGSVADALAAQESVLGHLATANHVIGDHVGALAEAAEAYERIARDGHALAESTRLGDQTATAVAETQAVTAHQTLMRLTAPVVATSDVVIDALRMPQSDAVSSAKLDNDAQARALAAHAILAMPDDEPTWQHAANLVGAATADVVFGESGGSDGGGGGVSPESEEPERNDFILSGMEPDEAAEWMRSQGEIRSDVQGHGVERFSEEYQEAIRAYFRHLGSEAKP